MNKLYQSTARDIEQWMNSNFGALLTMQIPVTKTITFSAPHGYLTVDKTEDSESYRVTYHNKIYKDSPFVLPTAFSTEFSIVEIVNSNEVRNLIYKITGELPN